MSGRAITLDWVLCACWVSLLVLTACKRSDPEPSRIDCREDLGCYIERARDCLPTVMVHTGLYPLNWSDPAHKERMSLRYEIQGRVRGRWMRTGGRW